MRFELPNYFLADLEDELVLTPTLVTEACQTIKTNRIQYLANRSTQSIINTLNDLGQSWLEEDNPYRRIALEKGVEATGFPEQVLARGLNAFFEQLTAQNLEELIIQDLGHINRLDEPVPSSAAYMSRRYAIATGPELIAHITAGNIPTPAIMSIVLGLLTRSAQFIKCPSGRSLIPRLFAHSLREIEPKLASCIEIAEWQGGTIELEEPLFQAADCITATGSNKTLEDIQRRLPITKKFIGYGHKVSFAYIAREMLTKFQAKKLVQLAADDITAWNQMGCLSPHVIYVETGGAISGEQFAEMLAEELQDREKTEPRGAISTYESAAIASRRAFYEVRAANSSHTKMWCSQSSTSWTVIFETDLLFQTSCMNRFIYVKSASNIISVLQSAVSVQGAVSTVGIAAPASKAKELVSTLAQWGVSRICQIGSMQRPHLAWRHDGRPSLAELVNWTDWEP
jgi:hypothetical protein